MNTNGVQITFSGVNSSGVEVMVNLQGDTYAEVSKMVNEASEFLSGMSPKPVKTFGGGFNKKPETVVLPDAPKNDKGESFAPVFNPKNNSYFWSISKFNVADKKYENEYAPRGTVPPTKEQYDEYLKLNPHIAAKLNK